ncbi:MAG TPA: polyprenyl synthetase family protein [Cyclobacteriaceae bacterium]|nr:polyprenyl synthetase family protein [Cyclobacteriaceae bacterium]
MTSQYLGWIESEIRKQKYGKAPASLYDPITYIMSLGGKRLRPLLVMLAYSLYKKDVKKIVPLATAIEAFHNFTLLHDDIMDQAPLRRGKETVHEKWNVNTAILSGDVMLVKVYDQLLKSSPGTLKSVISKFNACAAEVCEGQQWDMEFETMNTVTEKDYIQMIRQKTAVLLGFSLEFGAMLAKASANDQKALRNFGIDIGIGFQLKDDWLDVYGDNEKFGKQVGGDILSNKKTYLLITALAKAKGKDKSELNRWLSTNGRSAEKVKAVTAIYDRLGISNSTEEKINFYFARGFSQLKKIKVAEHRKSPLYEFTLQLIDRIS